MVAFLGAVVLAACKKKQDEQPPVVEVVAPYNYQSFAVYDNLYFEAEVSDETQLEFVSFTLVDANLQRVLPADVNYYDEKEVTATGGFVLDDVHLETGIYFALITAYDGINTTKKYIEINISGVPLQLQGVLPVLVPNSSSVEVHNFELQGSSTLHGAYASDYVAAAVNNYDQQLLVMGEFTGDLVSYHTETNNELWRIPAGSNLPDPYWQNLHFDYDSRLAYAITTDGTITAYDRNGNLEKSIASTTGYRAKMCRPLNELNYLVSCQKQNGINDYYLTVNQLGSGVFFQHLLLPGNVVEIDQRNTDELFVFVNDAVTGNGKILLYSLSGNSYWEAKDLSVGINDVSKVSNGVFLIAHSNGISYYTYSNNNLSEIVSDGPYQNIAFEDVNNQIIADNASGVSYFDAAGNLQQQAGTSVQPEAVLLWYNK